MPRIPCLEREHHFGEDVYLTRKGAVRAREGDLRLIPGSMGARSFEHRRATKGVECRKDKAVIDKTPKAYKPIDLVMGAQRDLVEVVYELRQVVCVKG